jgi:hypothetical protein
MYRLRHPPNGFDIYLVSVKTKRMVQIFVAFSEKLNFKGKIAILFNCALFFFIGTPMCFCKHKKAMDKRADKRINR